MSELYKAIDRMDGIIKALKISNQERQIIIDDLVESAVEKDKKLSTANHRVKELEGILTEIDK